MNIESNHEDRSGADFGPLLNLSIWTLSGAATGFLGLRLWAKVQHGRSLWYDDHVLLAAWTSLIVSCILQSIDVSLGFGKDFSNIEPGLVSKTRLLATAGGFFLILAACWSKTSFAITLLRIARGWPKRCVIFIIFSTNLFFAVSGLAHWLHCWPIRKVWMQDVEGECLPLEVVNGYNIAVSAYSGLMDVILAVLPWVIFRSGNLNTSASDLHTLHRKEKIGISVAMSMAVFAGITSFLKILAIVRVNMPNATPENVVGLMILGTAEGAVTIMAVSIPVLRTLRGGLKAEIVSVNPK